MPLPFAAGFRDAKFLPLNDHRAVPESSIVPDPPEHIITATNHDDNYFILHFQQLTNPSAQPHAKLFMGVGSPSAARVGVRRPVVFEN